MYPRDHFHETTPDTESGLCFVIMPFAPQFDAVWGVIRDTVAGPPFNMLCRRADDIARPGNIMSDVLSNIGRARLIVAELSGQNANVFYELGIAHTVKAAEDVILLSAKLDDIPFDLRQLKTVIYQGDHERLRRGLSQTLDQLGIRQYPLILKEGETGRVPGRLTGSDHCLYDIDITLDSVGDDGVKFTLQTVRHTAGSPPEPLTPEGYYLGLARPAMLVPDLDWYLCYTRTDDERVRFILGRQPGAAASRM